VSILQEKQPDTKENELSFDFMNSLKLYVTKEI